MEVYLSSNAQVNRERAMDCLRAGMTVAAIAMEFPEVFCVATQRGRQVLGQRYDYTLSDGRRETKRMITSDALRKVIARHRARERRRKR